MRLYNFIDGIRYKAIDAAEINLQAAKAIDTSAYSSPEDFVINAYGNGTTASAENWQEFEADFLSEMGLTDYKDSALAYYDAVRYGIADSRSSSSTVSEVFVDATSNLLS